jgi:Tfp pilus assembly protein FimT
MMPFFARRRRVRSLDERGLTVMELLVGLIVMGIVLAASLPGFRSVMRGHRHNGSIGQVTSRMFLTRQMAVRDRTNYVMTIDPVTDTFAVFQDNNGNGVADAGETTLGPWGLDTDVSIANVSWGGNQMTFFPNGTTGQTGDIRIFDNDGRTKTIRISSITGNSEVLP